MLRRAGWIAVLAVLLAVGGAVVFLLRGVVLQDREEPFPLMTETVPGPRQDVLDMVWVPHSTVEPSAPAGGDPGTHLHWVAGRPGVAHVTLPEPPGRTRLAALVAPSGSVYEWAGVLPSSASFEFRTGVLSSGTGVRFNVDLVDPAGQVHSLFSQTEVPHAPISVSRWIERFKVSILPLSEEGGLPTGGWSPARVDLSPWSGRPVRILLRVESPAEALNQSPGIAVWGAPQVWFPSPERPPAKRGRANPWFGTSVVLAVTETTPPGASLEGVPSPAGVFLRESVFFPLFYTSDIRPAEALKHLLFSSRLVPSLTQTTPPRSAWPRVFGENSYRSVAVGAFSDDMMDTLTEAGIDEIRQLPHDGHDPLLSARLVADSAQDRDRGPRLVIAFFRDLPAFRLPPVRFWAFSSRRFPWSSIGWRHMRRAAEGAYIEESVGRLMESLNARSPSALVAAVSLRGEVVDPLPVFWPGTGRRGKMFIAENGWGMREGEIRILFALRQGDRWEPGLCRSNGEILDVGPTLLKALEMPVAPGTGRAWDVGAAEHAEGSLGRWVVRSPWAKALIVDGRYKYIRHDLAAARSAPSWPVRPVSVRVDFPAEEIFDLWEDPGEHKNLTRSRRHLLARMRDVLGEADPDPVDVWLGFSNPRGARVDGSVTCSAGAITQAWGTVPISRGGAYEFSFSTTEASGTVAFRTWPPDSSYSMRLRVDGRPLSPGQFQVSRWGLPLFESMRNEWQDKTEFDWMDGWAPPVPSTGPVVSLGRVR